MITARDAEAENESAMAADSPSLQVLDPHNVSIRLDDRSSDILEV